MSFFLNFLKKSPEKRRAAGMIKIYINNENTHQTLDRNTQSEITCSDVCKMFAKDFSLRNKVPELRVMLVIEAKNKERTLINKRVMSPVEKIFQDYTEESDHATYKYFVVDMNDFIASRTCYLNFAGRLF